MDPSNGGDSDREYRGVLQPMVDEPVLAGGLLHGSGEGLPAEFIVAVTPTRVHAFRCSFGAAGVEVGTELAVWDRAVPPA
jgi:hypothetical protein